MLLVQEEARRTQRFLQVDGELMRGEEGKTARVSLCAPLIDSTSQTPHLQPPWGVLSAHWDHEAPSGRQPEQSQSQDAEKGAGPGLPQAAASPRDSANTGACQVREEGTAYRPVPPLAGFDCDHPPRCVSRCTCVDGSGRGLAHQPQGVRSKRPDAGTGKHSGSHPPVA